MSEQDPQLHSAVVALVSLAAGIAANHPHMGPCQLGRLRQMGVPQGQIDEVIEIARHIRDEAAQKLDAAFDERVSDEARQPGKPLGIQVAEACCTSTAGGGSCC